MKSKSTARSAFFDSGVVIAALFFAAMLSAAFAFGASSEGNNGIGSWTLTGSLNTPRFKATATLLPNGLVLVVGGLDGNFAFSNSAELYDPAHGTWTPTGNLINRRTDHTATLLPNGLVLVAGGLGSHGELASAELYDPATGGWTATGRLNTAREYHTATLLLNGLVLVAGGFLNDENLKSSELYDPASGSWTPTGQMNVAAAARTATLLAEGLVLVAGGSIGTESTADAELYDPASGSWAATGSLNTGRVAHTATLLLFTDMVLVAGGTDGINALASAELYDLESGNWTYTSSLSSKRNDHTANLLFDGTVLVVGGYDDVGISQTAELYEPVGRSWIPAANPNFAHADHTATLLNAGMVLVAGGFDADFNVTGSAELFTPPSELGVILLSAASRLTHGAAGTFDIGMPLIGPSGVECRDSDTYEAVLTFDVTVTSGDVSVVGGVATIGTLTFSGSEMIVPLTGVDNAQIVTLEVLEVNGEGQHLDVPFGFLIGDADSNRRVNDADIVALKAAYGRPVDNSNFRADFNPDGHINRKDRSDLRSHLHTSL